MPNSDKKFPLSGRSLPYFAIHQRPASAICARVPIPNSAPESSDVRRHGHSYGFECNEDALEVHPPGGDKQTEPFQLSFNSSLTADFRGSRVRSDGGRVLVGELNERLGFTELIE
jgi:hypothetical protein